ncbi:MAG: hypothetical protein V7739_20110 [Motiliproteus sp.]
MSETDDAIAGVIEYWTIWTAELCDKQREDFQRQKPGALPQLVTGQVIDDFQGRWRRGDAMRSSLISRIDPEKGRVYTQNSVYQLSGPGLHKTGIPRDYAQAVGEARVELSGLLDPARALDS